MMRGLGYFLRHLGSLRAARHAAGREACAMDDAVATWFAETNNPLAPVMLAVREVIMADPDVTETVKYRAPAFEHDGIMCYFNWSAKKRVSLIFPSGRSIPGEHPALEDGSNLQRMMYFDTVDEVAEKSDDLRAVIDAYMSWRAS